MMPSIQKTRFKHFKKPLHTAISWLVKASNITVCIWCFAVFSVTVSSTSFANDEEQQAKLEALQKTIADLKKQLEKTKSSRDSIAKSLEQSEKNISTLSKKAKKLKSTLNAEKKQLDELKDKRSELKKNKHKQQSLVGDYVNAAYRSGKKSQLHLLLNQQSPSDLSRTLKYYDYFVQARSKKIDEYLNTIDHLNKIEPEITASTLRLQNRVKEVAAQKNQLSAAQAQRKANLNRLNKEVQSQSSQLEKFLADRARLEELVNRVSEYIGDVEINPVGNIDFAKLKGQLPWPAKGKVINRFGSRRVDKLKWQGIRISGSSGEDIQAVHGGRVIFSDYLRGHGLLIILDHGSGFMTLYAHNQALYKDLGEWVSSGEQIASLGNSGGQKQAALYFELRRNGQPTNPLQWLRSA